MRGATCVWMIMQTGFQWEAPSVQRWRVMRQWWHSSGSLRALVTGSQPHHMDTLVLDTSILTGHQVQGLKGQVVGISSHSVWRFMEPLTTIAVPCVLRGGCGDNQNIAGVWHFQWTTSWRWSILWREEDGCVCKTVTHCWADWRAGQTSKRQGNNWQLKCNIYHKSIWTQVKPILGGTNNNNFLYESTWGGLVTSASVTWQWAVRCRWSQQQQSWPRLTLSGDRTGNKGDKNKIRKLKF